MNRMKNNFHKEAKALTFADMPKEYTSDFKIMDFSLIAFMLSFIIFILSLTGLFFETIHYYAGLSAICSFFIASIFLSAFLFTPPNSSFYTDTLEKIENNKKKLEKEQLKKHGCSEISPSMHHWGISQRFKKEKKSVYFESLEKFSKALPSQINDQDSNGNTIMHIMLMDDPDSPYIPTALLLNADINIQNAKGISVYQLLEKQKPQYLDFINKSITIAEKNTLNDTIAVLSSAKIHVNRI